MALGYRLQQVEKAKEGADHPDRDASSAISTPPVRSASVPGARSCRSTTNNKSRSASMPGPGGNGSRSRTRWKVNGHDCPAGVPKAIPYGIYDVGAGEGWGWGSVGARAETAAFAVNTLRQWWYTTGIDTYRLVELVRARQSPQPVPRADTWAPSPTRSADSR